MIGFHPFIKPFSFGIYLITIQGLLNTELKELRMDSRKKSFFISMISLKVLCGVISITAETVILSLVNVRCGHEKIDNHSSR